jgi:hypothetical protein
VKPAAQTRIFALQMGTQLTGNVLGPASATPNPPHMHPHARTQVFSPATWLYLPQHAHSSSCPSSVRVRAGSFAR